MSIIEVLYILVSTQLNFSEIGLDFKDRFLFIFVFIIISNSYQKMPYVHMLYSKSNIDEYAFLYIERFKKFLLIYIGMLISSMIFPSYEKSTLIVGLFLVLVGIDFQLYGYINRIISSRMPKATIFEIAKARLKVTGSIVASFFLMIILLIGLDYFNIDYFKIFGFNMNIKGVITLIYLIAVTINLHYLDYKYIIFRYHYIDLESLEMSRFINKYRKSGKEYSLFR